MAKPEWGVKRSCQSCGARFYDMMRTPVICPKCQSAVELEMPFKARRSASAEPKTPKMALVAAAAVEEVEADEFEAAEAEEGDADEIDGDDADESGLIEDASDLGEDDDDMAEVMEHMDEDLEDEV